jgi:hypothetical protein
LYRNISPDSALPCRDSHIVNVKEHFMAIEPQQEVVTPTEARQAEPGPSILALLAVSIGLAVLILGVVWFVFFRT